MVNFRTTSTPMTVRARLYLASTAATHWGMALALFLFPGRFGSESFEVVREISNGVIQLWAIGFVIVSILATLATLSGSEFTARMALTISAMLMGFWAAAFVLSAYFGFEVGPSAYILWSSLVAKDLIVGYYPLTAPLEPLLRRVRGERTPPGA